MFYTFCSCFFHELKSDISNLVSFLQLHNGACYDIFVRTYSLYFINKERKSSMKGQTDPSEQCCQIGDFYFKITTNILKKLNATF